MLRHTEPPGFPDEHQAFIFVDGSRFSFVVMVVAVQVYRALQFADQGNGGDPSFWLLVALWGSFLGGYVSNSVRH